MIGECVETHTHLSVGKCKRGESLTFPNGNHLEVGVPNCFEFLGQNVDDKSYSN
jgi:hypothetical protein